MSGSTSTAWSHVGSGFWGTFNNWTNGVPTSTVGATVDGPYTVTVNVSGAAAGSLLLNNSATVIGSLNISGDLSALAGSTFDSNGTTTIAGVATLDATSNLDIFGGLFTLDGDLSSGGTVDILGGQANFANVTGNFQVSGGGTAIIGGNVLASSTFTLAGSHVELGNSFGLTTLDFGAAGSDNIYLDNAATTLTNTFNGFAVGDTIGFLGATINGTPTLSGSTLSVSTSSGTYTFINFENAAGSTFTTGTETFGGKTYGFIELVCFVTGTRIRTERGEVAVEDIAAGDRVVTLEDGADVLRAVTWVGSRRLDIAGHARPELAAPVRIRAGAFGEALPRRDLLLSPDHCLFVDGKLVPAKLLVNDMTIVNEPATGTVMYYHVELERHAVLLAEGLPAESYLDTGNRAFFPNSGLPTVLHPEFHVNAGHHGWDDACAPLASDPAEVEALWHRLAARAEALGHVRPAIQTTSDADLHVIADGKIIRPVVSAGRHVFVLPAGTTSIRLESRYAIPADIAPYSDDRRRLGVAIGRITVRSDAGNVEIPADHPMLRRGWHPPERAGAKVWRWTDGDADLPLAPTSGVVVVEVKVQGTATYRLHEAPQPRRLAA